MDNRCDCFNSIYEKTVCYGTKDREECKCGGDKGKCDFYSDKRKSEVKDISHAESLLLNFFNGEIYFIFENEDEVKSFLEYVQNYDENVCRFIRLENIKSIAWVHSRLMHKHQIEYMNETEYFRFKYDMTPISYCLVKKYVEKNTKALKSIKKIYLDLKDIAKDFEGDE